MNLLCIYGQDKAYRFPLDFFKGFSDCIFPFLAVYALFECRCDGGEESQDFPENPNVLHCSDYKVYPLLGNSNTGILLVDFFETLYFLYYGNNIFYSIWFFFYRSILYIFFVALFTYFLLVDYQPNKITTIESICIFWIFTFIVDEIYTVSFHQIPAISICMQIFAKISC